MLKFLQDSTHCYYLRIVITKGASAPSNNEFNNYGIMIFTFRIVSDEVDNFKREIKIDATATFLDLKTPYARA